MTFNKRALAALSITLAVPLAFGVATPALGSNTPIPQQNEPAAGTGDFTSEVLASGLNNPFEVLYGPDDMLWVTERNDGTVTKVNPADGSVTTILTIPDVVATPGEQDGLLGMALHPRFLSNGKSSLGKGARNFVYLSYTYDGDPGEALDRRQKLVRYTYNPRRGTLNNPRELISGLIASDDHNSGRLVIGPDNKLYYTIGDRGNLQDLNACRPNLAQRLPTADEIAAGDWTAYQGKSLRLNLDGSIPQDNPEINGVRSHIYTYGHRNPQGLAFATNGVLYSSEQGPKSDDELNRLQPGGNYGWPNVAGYKDNSGYVFGDWSAAPGCGTTVPYDAFEIPDAVPQLPESAFSDPAFVQPLRTYYTVPSTHDFTGEACEPSGLFFICYPTIAPSSLDFYAQDEIPGWQESFLMPTLKDGTVYRVELAEDGESVGDSEPLWTTVNRYRDTAIDPDGTTIYVATDTNGLARGTNGDATSELATPGSILVFTYDGTVGD